MSQFQFKQFLLEQKEGAMKFGTDSAVLGAWAKHPRPTRILDIGTGTGVLALMLAQRYQCPIDAVEIELSAARQAQVNFRQSPWQSRLTVWHTPIQSFSEMQEAKYDLIISNPPYFTKALLPEQPERKIARHGEALSFSELAKAVSQLLSPSGLFYVILPCQQAIALASACAQYGLLVTEEVQVIPVEGKPVLRTIHAFSRHPFPKATHMLTIKDTAHAYTQQYVSLLKEYYLHF